MAQIRDLFAKIAERATQRAVALVGETYTYRRSSTVTQISGRLSVLNPSTQYAYFTSTESSGWASPRFLLTIAGDLKVFASASEPTSGDYVKINGTEYQVRKVAKNRIGGVVWKTLLFLAN